MDIIIGSKSRIKIEALRSACKALGIMPEITPCDVPSGVNAQPVGKKMIELGARRRASAAAISHPDAQIIMAVESGIYLSQLGWVDQAVIDLRTKTMRIIEWSEVVVFPTVAVEKARILGFEKTTVGEVLDQMYNIKTDDPHEYLTNGERTRQGILKRAIVKAFERALTRT